MLRKLRLWVGRGGGGSGSPSPLHIKHRAGIFYSEAHGAAILSCYKAPCQNVWCCYPELYRKGKLCTIIINC